MKKRNILLLSAAACVLAGLILAAGGWTAGGGKGFYIDRTGAHIYGAEPMQEGKKKLDEFQNIQIDLPGVAVTFVESDYYGMEYNLSPAVKIKRMETVNGILYVESDSSSFFQLNFLSFHTPENTIRIFYPTGVQFDRIKANVASGSINGKQIHTKTGEFQLSSGELTMEGLSASEIKIGMTSGDIRLSDIKTKNLSISNLSGHAELKDGECSGTLRAKTSSGDMDIERVSAKEMNLGITSGDIELSDCRAGKLISEQSSGDLRAVRMQTGGISCRITSGKAAISGILKGKNKFSVTSGDVACTTSLSETEYSYTVKKTSGKFRVNGEKAESKINRGASNTFEIDVTSGGVSLDFAPEI